MTLAILRTFNRVLGYEENLKHFADTPVNHQTKRALACDFTLLSEMSIKQFGEKIIESYSEVVEKRPNTIKLQERQGKLREKSLFCIIKLFYKAYCYKIAKQFLLKGNEAETMAKVDKVSRLNSIAMEEHKNCDLQMTCAVTDDLIPVVPVKWLLRSYFGEPIKLTEEIDQIQLAERFSYDKGLTEEINSIESTDDALNYLVNRLDMPSIQKLQQLETKYEQFFAKKLSQFDILTIVKTHKMAMKYIQEILEPYENDRVYEEYQEDFSKLWTRINRDCVLNETQLRIYENDHGPVLLPQQNPARPLIETSTPEI